jgi:hypothetical protein
MHTRPVYVHFDIVGCWCPSLSCVSLSTYILFDVVLFLKYFKAPLSFSLSWLSVLYIDFDYTVSILFIAWLVWQANSDGFWSKNLRIVHLVGSAPPMVQPSVLTMAVRRRNESLLRQGDLDPQGNRNDGTVYNLLPCIKDRCWNCTIQSECKTKGCACFWANQPCTSCFLNFANCCNTDVLKQPYCKPTTAITPVNDESQAPVIAAYLSCSGEMRNRR